MGTEGATFRKKTRELLVRLIFQMAATGEFSEEAKGAFLADTGLYEDIFEGAAGQVDFAYLDFVFSCVRENLEEIDAEISSASDKWAISRMGGVDLAILRVAGAELLFACEIDAGSSIDEAVRIAKKYGSEQSGAFVNGVLGGVVKKLEEEVK